MLPKKRPGQVSPVRWRARGRLVFWPGRPDGVLFYSAPLLLAAPPCATPTRLARSVSGFWIRQVRTNKTGRASEETFRTVVFGSLVGTRVKCLLGEASRRCPFRPGHAPPRPDPPVKNVNMSLLGLFLRPLGKELQPKYVF